MTVYRQVQTDPAGTRDLVWCAEHGEPAWVYDDGSVTCWWESIVETKSDEHVLMELDRATDLNAVPLAASPGQCGALCEQRNGDPFMCIRPQNHEGPHDWEAGYATWVAVSQGTDA